uniref:RanBP2-type domain-containing protein n=1 Tax=Alexandrium monilatum TaxID=311494 RepID=A0A7S4V4B4_9DINO
MAQVLKPRPAQTAGPARSAHGLPSAGTMSSWQQAVSADLYKGKKRVLTVALSGNQQKNLRTGRDDADIPSWSCAACSSEVPGVYNRCDKCGLLRPDERASRMELRKKDGVIGKGGGFFEAPSADDRRRDWNSDDEEYDEFGRKKRRTRALRCRALCGRELRSGPGTTGRSGAEASRDENPRAGSEAATSDRQRAALARLRQRGRGGRKSRSRSRSHSPRQ